MDIKENHRHAPGAPGINPKWTSSTKSGIGKSINSASDVSFTLSHGTVNEVFYPREDIASVRDIEFLVTDGKDFFSEEKKDTHHKISWLKEGVPAFHILNVCKQNKYQLEKEVITDPIRNTLLQQVIFKSCDPNKISDLHLYVLLAPHIGNKGANNNGWLGTYKATPMLFAQRDDIALALACSAGFTKRSVGYVGESDGYTDLKQHRKMEWEYTQADDGNIALTAEIDLHNTEKIIMATGFGRTVEEAGNNAWSSLMDGFEIAKAKYIYEWERWQRSLHNIKSDRNRLGRKFRTSAAVLRVHESRKFPGGIIASLSIPWGQSKGDGNLGGYHLVWPRDLALSSGGFLELKAKDDVLRILNYMMSTQEEDGRWSQNMWLEGIPFFTGIQMDEIALPVLLVGTAYQKNFLDEERCKRYWPVVKKALRYLILHGPCTKQDRWEEESGYTPFTLAAEISALLAGALLARANGEEDLATYCEETADYWNENIERWLYVSGTALSDELGIDGYYIRINPYDRPANDVKNEYIKLKNHRGDDGKVLVGELISADALALVRFGLRDAKDPRILNTIKAIDATLKTEMPTGPCWHRYNNDGYGEDADGNPYSGHGTGRAWPLLTGERAHYEIAAGNIQEAKRLLLTMESFANNSLFPEQVWDEKDIPEKGLYFGKYSGSAMPLTWAHAEYIKLCSSIKKNKIADMPTLTEERYLRRKSISTCAVWRFNSKTSAVARNKKLRIEVMNDALVKWTDDNWQTSHDISTTDTDLGFHFADIRSANKTASEIKFTFFWNEPRVWENADFSVSII